MRATDFVRQYGLRRFGACVAAKIGYGALQRVFHFDPWHASAPYACRPYKQRVVALASSVAAQLVVDIGCGLGETLVRVPAAARVGFDVDPGVISAARLLHGRRASFHVGNLLELETIHAQIRERIDLLVCVNVLHRYAFADVRNAVERLRDSTGVARLLVDGVREGTLAGAHCLDHHQLGAIGAVEVVMDAGDGTRDLYLVRIV